MTKMNPVVHFEMPYEDKYRAAEFYEKTFGWKPETDLKTGIKLTYNYLSNLNA